MNNTTFTNNMSKCQVKMNVGELQLRVIIIDILLIGLLMLMQQLFSTIEPNNQIGLVAVLGLNLTAYILIVSFNVIKRIDGYMIFMALSFVFMFGEQELFLLGIKMEDMWIYRKYLRYDTIYITGFFTLYTYLVMHIGYSLTLYKRVIKVNIPAENLDIRSRQLLMKAGIIIAILVLYPTVDDLIQNIILTMTMGYGERIYGTVQNGEVGTDTIMGILTGLMIPALLAMFIGKKKDSNWPWVLIFIYCGLYMLSGSRLKIFCLLCGIMYAYFLVHSSLTKRKIISVFLAIFAIGTLFSFVSQKRGDIDSDSKDIIVQLVDNNPVIAIFKEMGFTACATGAVLEHCPSDKPYLYGKSYLSGLVYTLPNAFTGNYYVKTPEVDSQFKDYITPGSGIGSSFIAEGYYNFGWLSLLLFFVYGYLFGVYCNKLERVVNACDFPKIFLYIGLFCIIIFYVRSDTRTFFRNFIWYYVPIYLYCKVLKSRRSKIKYRKT